MTKIVAIVSVKGGVGKTLVSLNIALRLAEQTTAALIDADIDNANFSQFTGIDTMNIKLEGSRSIMLPLWRENIKVFSMSLLAGRRRGISITNEDAANLVADVLRRSDARYMDTVIVDMPPGAGTIFRKVLETAADDFLGSVLVSQPAMMDSTIKTLEIHSKLDIPVLGLVENMAYIDIDGKRYHPFGEPVGEEICSKYGYKYYGAIPIVLDMYDRIKKGNPYIESPVLDEIARDILSKEPQRATWLEKVRNMVLIPIKEHIEQILVNTILKIQREFDLTDLQKEFSLTDEMPFELNIVTEDFSKIITSVKLRVKKGKLVVVKDVEPAFKIYTDIRTLARILTGVYKANDGSLKPYDPLDAWLMGKIRVTGEGFLPKAIAVMSLITNTRVKEIINKFYNILINYV